MAAALDTVPCLERLTQLRTLNIDQTSAGGYHGCSYAVLSEDEVLFNLTEVCHAHSIFAGGNNRAFHMDGVDNAGRKIISLRRPAMYTSDKIELYMNNALACVIRMENTLMTTIYSINDAQDCPTLRVKEKDRSHFKLQTLPPSKTTIGSIEKKWRGWKKELMASYKDNYVITFPADLAVQFKVAVIVACILIDFNFSEGK